MTYYRPIARSGFPRPDSAMTLAGGWCWFDQVEVLQRDRPARMISAQDLPKDVALRLTAPRPSIAGLAMDRPRVMGILNVTPDSFSDGGRFDTVLAARDQALRMQADGADILDIGGESTRPGATPVDPQAEISRTSPVIDAIRAHCVLPISIDTRNAAVARAALAAGAEIINDVAALTHDPDMARVAARVGVPVCLMHARGDPQTMQDHPVYANVVLDVYDFLAERIEAAVAAGIARDRIIVDPGIGFGKTLQHNVTLLRHLSLYHGFGCPILLGASRKRFIGTIGQAAQPQDRLGGSVAVALHGAAQGVQILRVHDTRETRQALSLQQALG